MNCKHCGGKMMGDGVTEVLHCEHVYIGIDVAPDHDPIHCDKDINDLCEELIADIQGDIEMWQKTADHLKTLAEEVVVGWCDYCNSFKKVFCRVEMGGNQEHLYCEGCIKEIFWFAFSPEDNPVELSYEDTWSSGMPSMAECYGSGRTCETEGCFNTPQEGETFCCSCWNKHI